VKLDKWPHVASRVMQGLELTVVAIKRILSAGTPENYLKEKNRSLQDSGLSGWRYKYSKWTWDRRKKRLKAFYSSRATKPDYSRPYVFIPLHYQPERITCPDGGMAMYQDVLVDCVSRIALENDWDVYVKENPAQFFPSRHGERARDCDFYRRLTDLPNVTLVDIKESTFDLIDNAQAVVTVKGTAGWEAVVRGVPSFVFGNAWYWGCEGVFKVTHLDDLREGMDRIAAGYRVNREKVALFFHAAELVSKKGNFKRQKVARHYQDQSADTERELVDCILLNLAEQRTSYAARDETTSVVRKKNEV